MIVNMPTTLMVIASIFLQLSRCILYATDVITDLITGSYFINGTYIDQELFGNANHTNYTNLVCDEFDQYAHPIWGSMVFLFSWAPAIVLVPPLFASVYKRTKIEGELAPAQLGRNVVSYWRTIIYISILIMVWPLTGIIM